MDTPHAAPHTPHDRPAGLRDALWRLVRTKIPPERGGLFSFGWLILIAFAFQLVTGVLLSFYYEVGPDSAADSVRFIVSEVGFGWLVRGLHHWCSTAILVLALLQLVRALSLRAYRGAGAACWYLGFFLLALVFASGLTGDLLPWDDRAYWTATRTMEVVEGVPLFGPWLATLLRGGPEVAGHALSRIHAVHTLLLPALGALAVVLNLWMLARRRREERGGAR